MISGPTEAVKVWATERFGRLDAYLSTTAKPGNGIHPVKYLAYDIFPYIEKEFGYTLHQNKRVCFVRVRADGGIWIDDCRRDGGKFPQNATYLLQKTLLPAGSTCHKETMNEYFEQLYCDLPIEKMEGNDKHTGVNDDIDWLWNLRTKPL
jgi:hypothetical protein